MVGFWATLSLNIPDFTRYARSQRDQVVGQVLGLPGTMILFSFIGVAVTSATPIIFGEVIWDPVKLLGKVGGPLVTLLAMLALSIATLSTNLAANVVSPANDFSNLSPGKISYKTGGIITAVIGALMFPWKLIESSGGYIFTWLIGYSALLGPVAGIMVADYFLVRRRELSVEDLYKRGGQYEFIGGVNWKAMLALAIGVAVNVPGFLAEAVPALKNSVPGFWRTLYTYAWFVGFLLSGGLHYVLATASAPPKSEARLEPGR
jgi:NCS1 family nucleobase:cation symporter-1